jgi:hypothetical protein
MFNKVHWQLLIFAVGFAMAFGGCAEMPYGIEGAEHRYEKHQYLGLSSENPQNWNATDWSLWMNSQGGG